MVSRTRPQKVTAASLVLDYGLYPRHHLNEVNVRSLADAMDAGVRLPPVVADRASLRVTDGFHRVRAALRKGEGTLVEVEFRDYASDGEMFLDAVQMNAGHGAKLTPYDHARVIAMAETWHIGAADVAAALSVPLATLDKVRDERTAFRQDGKPVQIKRSFKKFRGQTLTEPQVEANGRASGWPARFHAEQLINLIDADAVDWGDEGTLDAFSRLASLLSGRLAAA